ncbi:hypothetical protein [Chitinophaga silvisoli]|uniref:Uncharacterized protein n=1 Tax=Chitinophaga silvisoli TaxID=2291814 RepID=A0A3E1NTH9_9BACT|nr:hypothetical protein [Chitinophaga silvisoli]RFM31236.1 hypothetical protein DXN04_29335 [Chitinophaga silvisoli]
MDQNNHNGGPFEMQPVLASIYETLLKLPLQFREDVCKELDFSIPTYYRTMRESDKDNKGLSKSSRIDQKKIEIVVSLAYMELVKAVNYIKDNFMQGRV